MPIKIPNDLPARAVLDRERVPVITEDVALRQDIRPLQIALLNLMPDKVRTETQLLRVLGGTPLQIEMALLRAANHEIAQHADRAPDRVLQDLGRGPAPPLRRSDRDRCPDRAPAVRKRRLLGRAGGDLRMDQGQCL